MNGEENLSDRLARQARELVETAGSTTGRLARLGRLQLDLLGIKREMQQEYRQLGERALELIRAGEVARLGDDPMADPVIRRLEKLDAERILRERQIEEAKGTE
jgi:hypothetical protein